MDDLIKELRIETERARRFTGDTKWNHRDVISPYSRLYFVTAGEGFWSSAGRTLRLTPGNAYLIPADTLFDVWTERSISKFYAHIFVRSSGGAGFLDAYELAPEASWRKAPFSESMLGALADAAGKTDPAARLLYEGLMRVAISMFLRGERRTQKGSPHLERVERAVKFIDANPFAKTTLPELAAMVSLHPTYFSNLFCECLGVPPFAYIARKRVETAKSMLLKTDMPVKEIAVRCGYEELFYFSRVFKKHTGLSPAKYRASARMTVV
jgi:AraC-like DNA-binding protein